MKNRRVWMRRGAAALAAGAALAGVGLWAMESELTISRYDLELPKGLEELDGLCVAHLSDVHSANIQGALQKALSEVQPDLIVVTGDVVNREDRDLSRALGLMAMAVKQAPVYFVPGNHEADSPCYPELREGLLRAGVTVLEDSRISFSWGSGVVNLIGVWDIRRRGERREESRKLLMETARDLRRQGALNLLLSHRPSLFPEYVKAGVDVVFSGHAHGGQVRMPLVGPLYSTDEGIFPAYTSGVHWAGRTQMVISRGLGNGTPAPRLWNGPELVKVTFHGRV